ncbi:MAG: hypothetical protein ACKPJJ_33465, partial [Planctomycetaceae bacterium]
LFSRLDFRKCCALRMFQKHKLPLDNRNNHSFRQTLPDLSFELALRRTQRAGQGSCEAAKT